MILPIAGGQNKFAWMFFHVLLGVSAVFSNLFVISWFYFILLSSFYLLVVSAVDKPLMVASTMVYIGGFELIARMTKCSPVIPWEASKYLFMILSILGIWLTRNRPAQMNYAWLIILLALPATFFDHSGEVDFNEIIFNVLGIINIGLGILFFSKLTITRSGWIDFIRMMVYPCIAVLSLTVIKTPDLKDIQFSLGAKFSTSGEFGSNQVSTVLGLGFLLLSYGFLMNWKLTSSRMLDGILALGFLVQGLLTFSRGGMISSAAALVVFLIYMYQGSRAVKQTVVRFRQFIIPLVILVLISVWYVNVQTEGNLFLRYQGETYGTMLGTREKDLATITSNRNVVFMDDLQLWVENPVLGVGVGASKYLREHGKGLAAHVELSRLLAEQGFLGLMVFILLLFPVLRYARDRDPLIRATRLGLFTLALLTTFHSATRTFLTPLLLTLCTVTIISEDSSNDIIPGK